MDNEKENSPEIMEWFGGDALATDVYNKKYRNGSETPNETMKRLAGELVRNEMKYYRNVKRTSLKKLSRYGALKMAELQSIIKKGGRSEYEKFMMDDIMSQLEGFDKLLPGGSIISTLGTDEKLSLSNCFVINSPKDSLCGINDTINEMENIFSRRGGVGVDLSTVRPAGASVHNAARLSDGVVTLMKHKFAESTKYIAQNGRRGALMLMYDSRGCDLPEFIKCKQDDTSITTANISVKMHDDFIFAAEKDEDYILRFPVDVDLKGFENDIANSVEYGKLTEYELNGERIYVRKVKAKEIWDDIIKCAWNKAEPGVLFWDTIIDYDPSSVYERLKPIATNPCGEQPLGAYDTCRLISYNLSKFVDEPFTEKSVVDYDRLYATFYDIQWYADDIVDLECEYVHSIIDKLERDGGNELIIKMWNSVISTALRGRRTGVGFTGLGDMFAELNTMYGDVGIIEDVFSTIFKAQLDSTIDLSIIRGSFLEWDPKLETGNSWYSFVEREFPEQYVRMKKYGRRNVSFNTCAPAGSISILSRCTSGIEPLFMPYYKRKVKVDNVNESYDVTDADGCRFKVYTVVHPGLKKWIEVRYPDVVVGDLSDTDLEKYYKESPYFGNCAQDLEPSDRVFAQTCMQTFITSSISSTVNLKKTATVEDVDKIFNEAWDKCCKGITIYRDGCRDGVMTSVDTSFNQSSDEIDAPKRPKTLNCSVIRFSNNSDKWIAFVGEYNGRPYEIFTGMLMRLNIPSYVEKGTITKTKVNGKSVYDFEYFDKNGEVCVIEGINYIFNKEFWNYGKLLSGLLRHRMPVACIIKTLKGMTFDNDTINSWRNGVIRSLKKWVKDGTESGETCPECGSKLIYENGCKRCPHCTYSACN